LSFDVAAAARRVKAQRPTDVLKRRTDADLPFVVAPASPGPELMLDTCVYIDVLQGRTPAAVDDLLQLRIVNHSTVALAELTHAFGRLDPAHADTRKTLRELSATIAAIPAHRLSAPTARTSGEAGMLAGLVARLSGRPSGIELLNDATLLRHGAETGCTVLTRNVADFDLMQQVTTGSSVLFYRTV
jgi:predicted nucleic acid-binding protein